jgi:hypothetical protein
VPAAKATAERIEQEVGMSVYSEDGDDMCEVMFAVRGWNLQTSKSRSTYCAGSYIASVQFKRIGLAAGDVSVLSLSRQMETWALAASKESQKAGLGGWSPPPPINGQCRFCDTSTHTHTRTHTHIT